MAIRSWNDDGSELRVPTVAETINLNGIGQTLAALVMPAPKTDWEAVMSGRDLTHTRSAWNFGMSPSNKPFYESTTTGGGSITQQPDTDGVLTDSQWYIIVYTANPTRSFHIFDLDATTWTHLGNDLGPGALDDAGPSDFIEFGRNIAYGFELNALVAIAAIWDVGLSEAEIEALSATLATGDWFNHDIPPRGLWSFNQALVGDDVYDVMGNHDTITGSITSDTDLVGRTDTTIVTGSDPPGWDLTIPPPVLDFKIYLSGGASNEVGSASIGGPMSSTLASDVFDDVSATQALVGMVDYRLVYVRNNEPAADGSIVGFISDQLPDAGHEIAVGAATEAAGVEVTPIANDTTAPAGVTFAAPTDLGSAADLGTVTTETMKGVWLRRTTPPASADSPTNPWEVTIEVTPL